MTRHVSTQKRKWIERGMDKALARRILVIGNGGSGKSWLSTRMAEMLATEALDLDEIHWEPGGYNTPRDPRLCIEMVRQASARPDWIIEGVYGWLAR